MNSRNNSKIKKLAESIALLYEDEATPLEKIIEDEDLDVFYDNYERNTFDGMTVYDEGYFYIHINIDRGNIMGSDRGRFTLAHELGHYYIENHRIGLKKGLLKPHPSICNNEQYYLIEREADYFASCLLMPELRFCKDINNRKFEFSIIEDLRYKYKVSRTACLLRFADIGNQPIMVLYAENNRIKWKYNSKDFPFKYFIYDDLVPKHTVMEDYFKGHKDDIFKTEVINAIECFKYVKEEDIGRHFYEHCISYKNKALSVFWED